MHKIVLLIAALVFGLGLKISPLFAQVNPGKSISNVTQRAPGSHKKRYGYQKKFPGFSRRGDLSQRFEIRHGDCWRRDCNYDRQRIEKSEKPRNTMQRSNKVSWYGYSMFIPKSYKGLGNTGTTYGQVKTEADLHPIWWVANYGDNMIVLFYEENTYCQIGKISSWTGRWVDIVVMANYGTSGAGPFFEIYKNGKLVCSRKTPMILGSLKFKSHKFYFRYGIYNSFVSRWLSANATKEVDTKKFSETFTSGSNSTSATRRPFKYDWGVKLPTQIVFYDEMRFGKTRDEVDVRLHEKLRLAPVD